MQGKWHRQAIMRGLFAAMLSIAFLAISGGTAKAEDLMRYFQPQQQIAQSLPQQLAAATPAQVREACGNCDARYCSAHPDIPDMKRSIIERMRADGFTSRFINLVEAWQPVCIYCLQSFNESRNFSLITYDNDGGPHYGLWSPQYEAEVAQQLREGRISRYVIRITPCNCCGTPRHVEDRETYDDDLGIDRNAAHVYDNPNSLPDDIGAGIAGQKQPVPEPRVGRDIPPPGVAQPLCPACREAADAINEAAEALYQAYLAHEREVAASAAAQRNLIIAQNAILDLKREFYEQRINRTQYDARMTDLRAQESAYDREQLRHYSNARVLLERTIPEKQNAYSAAIDAAQACEQDRCERSDAQPVPEIMTLPEPAPPRFAQAACFACRGYAAELNAANDDVFEAETAIVRLKNRLSVIAHDMAVNANAMNEARYMGRDAELERLQGENAALGAEQAQRQSELEQFEASLAAAKQAAEAAEAALLACESGRACNPPDDDGFLLDPLLFEPESEGQSIVLEDGTVLIILPPSDDVDEGFTLDFGFAEDDTGPVEGSLNDPLIMITPDGLTIFIDPRDWGDDEPFSLDFDLTDGQNGPSILPTPDGGFQLYGPEFTFTDDEGSEEDDDEDFDLAPDSENQGPTPGLMLLPEPQAPVLRSTNCERCRNFVIRYNITLQRVYEAELAYVRAQNRVNLLRYLHDLLEGWQNGNDLKRDILFALPPDLSLLADAIFSAPQSDYNLVLREADQEALDAEDIWTRLRMDMREDESNLDACERLCTEQDGVEDGTGDEDGTTEGGRGGFQPDGWVPGLLSLPELMPYPSAPTPILEVCPECVDSSIALDAARKKYHDAQVAQIRRLNRIRQLEYLRLVKRRGLLRQLIDSGQAQGAEWDSVIEAARLSTDSGFDSLIDTLRQDQDTHNSDTNSARIDAEQAARDFAECLRRYCGDADAEGGDYFLPDPFEGKEETGGDPLEGPGDNTVGLPPIPQDYTGEPLFELQPMPDRPAMSSSNCRMCAYTVRLVNALKQRVYELETQFVDARNRLAIHNYVMGLSQTRHSSPTDLEISKGLPEDYQILMREFARMTQEQLAANRNRIMAERDRAQRDLGRMRQRLFQALQDLDGCESYCREYGDRDYPYGYDPDSFDDPPSELPEDLRPRDISLPPPPRFMPLPSAPTPIEAKCPACAEYAESHNRFMVDVHAAHVQYIEAGNRLERMYYLDEIFRRMSAASDADKEGYRAHLAGLGPRWSALIGAMSFMPADNRQSLIQLLREDVQGLKEDYEVLAEQVDTDISLLESCERENCTEDGICTGGRGGDSCMPPEDEVCPGGDPAQCGPLVPLPEDNQACPDGADSCAPPEDTCPQGDDTCMPPEENGCTGGDETCSPPQEGACTGGDETCTMPQDDYDCPGGDATCMPPPEDQTCPGGDPAQCEPSRDQDCEDPELCDQQQQQDQSCHSDDPAQCSNPPQDQDCEASETCDQQQQPQQQQQQQEPRFYPDFDRYDQDEDIEEDSFYDNLPPFVIREFFLVDARPVSGEQPFEAGGVEDSFDDEDDSEDTDPGDDEDDEDDGDDEGDDEEGGDDEGDDDDDEGGGGGGGGDAPLNISDCNGKVASHSQFRGSIVILVTETDCTVSSTIDVSGPNMALFQLVGHGEGKDEILPVIPNNFFSFNTPPPFPIVNNSQPTIIIDDHDTEVGDPVEATYQLMLDVTVIDGDPFNTVIVTVLSASAL